MEKENVKQKLKPCRKLVKNVNPAAIKLEEYS